MHNESSLTVEVTSTSAGNGEGIDGSGGGGGGGGDSDSSSSTMTNGDSSVGGAMAATMGPRQHQHHNNSGGGASSISRESSSANNPSGGGSTVLNGPSSGAHLVMSGSASGGSAGGSGGGGPGNECAGCGKRITDRFLLKALDLYWHEDCLKCGCCDCRLGEVGSTLYTKANLILCKRDYLRLFGNTGYCAACTKVIPAFEMVMRARNNVYHLECFACQQCNHRFCVGDRFYLCDNKILCEYDYEERMVFANMAYSPGNLTLLRNNPNEPVKNPGVHPNNQSVSNNMHNNMNSGPPNSTNNSLSPKLQSLSPSSMVHHHNNSSVPPPNLSQRTAT